VDSSQLVASPASPADVILLSRELSSVSTGRAWFARLLEHQDVPLGAIEDAVLVLSELVTNALRHGRGDVVCHVAVSADGTHIHAAVTDAGGGMPVLREPDPTRIGGVGLQIVDHVANRWGVSWFPCGKTVWASIPVG
jgi:serine/threonine-protein kinase RsbW